MSPKQRSVILDVDVGTDDAWAILLLLNYEAKLNFKVRAITCVFGNSTVKNIGKNVLRVLETVDRLDVPVFLGCDEPLIVHEPISVSFHGVDGLCDVEYETEPDTTLIRKSHAVEAMYEILAKSDDEVTFICLGPLTNLALLYKMHPDSRDRIHDIFVMGGNRHGVGNITRAAEFNFYCDPEAAFVVFQSSKCLIKLFPLETIQNCKATTMEWRMNVIGKIDHKITRLLNPIEKKGYEAFGLTDWTPYDAYCAASFIDASIIRKTENFHMTIELSGKWTRGQVVIDHIDEVNFKNVTVIEEIDVEKFNELILTTLHDATCK